MPRLVFTDFDFQNTNRPINLPAPTADGHAANKAYVDSSVEGLAWKDSCRVATQANINLASPGATIDAITMATGDRVLVRAQTAGAENGIYVWNGASTAMARSLDANTFAELKQAAVSVEEGTGASVTYRQTTASGTLGTTALSWTTFGTSAPAASTTQAGVSRFATQAEADAGTAGVVITADVLLNWSGRIRKATGNIGDGSATSFVLTHNFNTLDVLISVFSNSGQYDDITADFRRIPSVNAVTIVFGSAPALNAYRVVVIG